MANGFVEGLFSRLPEHAAHGVASVTGQPGNGFD